MIRKYERINDKRQGHILNDIGGRANAHIFFAYDINAIIDNGPSAAGDDDLIGGEQPTQNPNNTHMFRIWFT